MATFLFDKTIFGPVNSRRLGLSLGINLLPNTRKVCNFNCIYCECGWNSKSHLAETLPTPAFVKQQLFLKLTEMCNNNTPPHVITFAGNGEPTMHPQFKQIVINTIELRNQLCPNARIAVLSNATLINHNKVFEALLMVDQNILKLDSAIEATVSILNSPPAGYTITNVIEGLKKFNSGFILQTMFVKGSYNNVQINNTTPPEIEAWLNVINETQPNEVMIYTIARDTPAQGLQKISLSELNNIAKKVEAMGIKITVSE